MKRVILFSLLALVACKKDKTEKNVTTHTIQVTGNSFNSVFTCNGQTYYGGIIPTLSISTGQIATYKDAGYNSQKNVAITIDGLTVWSYNSNGVAQYTYTAN